MLVKPVAEKNHSHSNLKSVAKVFTCLALIALGSCSKDEDKQPPSPAISGITPKAGVATMQVTITGNDFSEVLSDISVSFNGVDADIISATSSEIVVEVPEGGSTGPVTVVTEGEVLEGPSFRYYDVLILANEFVPNGDVIVQLWRNGAFNPVTDGVGAKRGWALAVDGDDIFIAGDTLGNNMLAPVYWKNGILYPLPLPAERQGSTSGIAVSEDDVFVSGAEYAEVGGPPFAKYWKNGIGTYLKINEEQVVSSTNLIFQHNEDVYIGGGTSSLPVYWKNGNEIFLPADESLKSKVNDIKIVGSDMHIVGNEELGGKILYWKNGISTPMISSGEIAGGFSLGVVGNDVYIVGIRQIDFKSIATIWKNGVPSPVLTDVNDTYASKILVIDQDIIILGGISRPGQDVPFYKINDNLFILDVDDRYVNPIAIVVR
jgi:hypothetical protein